MLEPADEEFLSAPDLHQTFERRGYVRYAHRFGILWQFLGMEPNDLISARVFDLSTTGLGLIVDQEFPTGKVLMLRLPSATLGWNSHLVRVKHCRLQDDGTYQVGCSFVKPLSDAQLEAHLQI